MKTSITNLLRHVPSVYCITLRYILCVTIFAFIDVRQARCETWTSVTVDSVSVGNDILVGRLHSSSKGSHFYSYYVKSLKEKRDSIHKRKSPFDLYYTTPLYRDYPLFLEEFRKNNDYVIALFENNNKGYTDNQMCLTIYLIIDEDGTSFCHRIRSRIRLTDVFTASELMEKIRQVGSCRYTTPLVTKPKHGYLELSYY